VIYLTVQNCVYTGLLERKFSAAERSLIVKTHNKLRKLVEKGLVKGQPRSVKMKRLVGMLRISVKSSINRRLQKWDARLAKEAQKIADTCQFKHVAVKDGR
jgi:hypothetical protein